MTTEEIVIALLCTVDDPIESVKKVPQATLYPGEVVTISLLFALKGGHFRAFYGCLKRDYARLFDGLPDRTTSGRPVVEQQALCDGRVATPRVLNVLDSSPTLNARFAYTAAMFNLRVRWSRLLDPADPFNLSSAQFSL